jgi:plasmid stabilization system protein ParE
MVFRVELMPRAQRDLDSIFSWVVTSAPFRGPQWCEKFERAIRSLEQFPERCTIEPNLSTATRQVRVLLFGRKHHVYGVYFSVHDDVVRVLHIRSGARREPNRV